MIDINLIRENRKKVEDNLRKKFQDEKIPLLDEVLLYDKENREAKLKGDNLRNEKNKKSSLIGALMRDGKKEEAENIKNEISKYNEEIILLEQKEEELSLKIKEIMMNIPNIIDDSVPVGKDDSENVEIEKYGEPIVPSYEIPYHADIIEKLNGLDKDAAGKTSGQGFYYLIGDIARLHEAMLAYARDFMIGKGFTYAIPPFMIRSDVVTGVMSFKEMESMMYKIEGEDLYLIGTSEHSMIGRFKGEIVKE